MSQVSPKLDAAVRTAYNDQPFAADRIFVDPDIRTPFLHAVGLQCPEASEREVLEHLERLRKRGADNGGLPRKQR